MMKLSVTTAFITNSSSVVHGFDKTLLEEPRVKAFMERYEIQHGFVGPDLWSRSTCGSVVITEDQKAAVQHELSGYEEAERSADSPVSFKEEFGVIYGDEYDSVASELCHLISEIVIERDKLKGIWRAGSNWTYDYN